MTNTDDETIVKKETKQYGGRFPSVTCKMEKVTESYMTEAVAMKTFFRSRDV